MTALSQLQSLPVVVAKIFCCLDEISCIALFHKGNFKPSTLEASIQIGFCFAKCERDDMYGIHCTLPRSNTLGYSTHKRPAAAQTMNVEINEAYAIGI